MADSITRDGLSSSHELEKLQAEIQLLEQLITQSRALLASLEARLKTPQQSTEGAKGDQVAHDVSRVQE